MTMSSNNKSKGKPEQKAPRQDPLKNDPRMEIDIYNSGAGQPHNAKKEGLGPNTNR